MKNSLFESVASKGDCIGNSFCTPLAESREPAPISRVSFFGFRNSVWNDVVGIDGVARDAVGIDGVATDVVAISARS